MSQCSGIAKEQVQAGISTNEVERMRAVRRYDILDTPPDGVFDRITALAARLFQVPIAIVSIVDSDRIWFKSHHGIEASEVERVPGLCASAILQNVPYIVQDALKDASTLANPLVAGDLGLRFYAGAPLVTTDGFCLGTLCVIDQAPRALDEKDVANLEDLASLVMDQLELRLRANHHTAELIIAKASAEKANQAKSDFLSNMSHELRSPLNAILGFAQLMESDEIPQSAPQKEGTGEILKAGWYLLDLINEVLDLGLIESGKLILSKEPMALDEVMLDCQAMIEPQAQKSGIAMQFCRFKKPCLVQADRTRVKQILINLLSNAIKYNKAGGTVTIGCTVKSPGRIRVSVTDTGPGLSPEKLAQLFQPFNRLGQESSGEEGTGIGLVVTKKLVELMGGDIGVESSVGSGCEFWVELIAVADSPLELEAAERTESLPGGAQKPLRDPALRTILYIEDNPADLKLVELLIARRRDMHLLTAADAKHGIELARKHQPELMLMDINLPGIGGLKALKILREDRLTQHIPVVAISACALPQDVCNGIEAGFFRYLSKPIRVDLFMEMLDETLDFSKPVGSPANL